MTFVTFSFLSLNYFVLIKCGFVQSVSFCAMLRDFGILVGTISLTWDLDSYVYSSALCFLYYTVRM